VRLKVVIGAAKRPHGPGASPDRGRLAPALLTTLWVSATPLAVAGQTSAQLDRYDFETPPALHVPLPEELTEISGLAFSSDGRLFAHADERAFVYEIDPDSGEALSRFHLGRQGIQGDFEGIAIAGNRHFLVSSEGELFEFRPGQPNQSVEYERVDTGFDDRCEVEGLAFDRRTNSLLLACKTPQRRDLEDHLVVFAYSLDTMSLVEEPRVHLPLSAASLGAEDLNPSGIEVEPTTGHLVIVASQQRLLVELSREGIVLALRELPRRFHRQSEGVTFRPDGALLIADEGDGEDATISAYLPTARE
jgi:uncharacterized protein YjiK